MLALNLPWRFGLESAIMYMGVSGLYIVLNIFTPKFKKLLNLLFFTWSLLWSLNLTINAMILWQYGMMADSKIIFESILNTSAKESLEWLLHYFNFILIALLANIIILIALWWLFTRIKIYEKTHYNIPKLYGFSALAIIFFLINHTNPYQSKKNPLIIWPQTYIKYQTFISSINNIRDNLANIDKKSDEWGVKYEGNKKSVFILLIGESINSQNMQLYGYERKTTPMLNNIKEELIIFKDVISSAGSTIKSIKNMLTFQNNYSKINDNNLPTIPQIARKAGYKLYFISNQNDRITRENFAYKADFYKILNIGGHRDDSSLDEKTLPFIEEALNDNADKKFIIIQLLGAHPHYSLRYPENFNKYEGVSDEVTNKLKEKGRSFWVINDRNYYDNAILYQDFIITTILKMLQDHGQQEKSKREYNDISKEFLFISDHGQEVGHLRDFSGHSHNLSSGYTIPMIIWSNDKSLISKKQLLEQKPFQSDDLNFALLDLLNIKTKFDYDKANILSEEFIVRQRKINNNVYKNYKQ